MKKFCFLLIFQFHIVCVFSQQTLVENRTAAFKACGTPECRLSEAIRNSEFYIETDHMDKAQQWLDVAKKLQQSKPNDSISYFINSLQSEVFYYMEL